MFGGFFMYYALLAFAAVLISGVFAVNKEYQKMFGTASETGLAFHSVLGLFTAMIFFCLCGFKVSFTPFSFALSAAMNILVVAYSLIGFKLLKSGTMALYTVFLMSGGMILPYIYGLIFLDEPLKVLRIIGLFVILSGVIISNYGKAKTGKKEILMCIAVFILNGFVSIINKTHQVETVFETVGTKEFVFIGGAFRFVLCGVLFLLLSQKNKKSHQSGEKKANLAKAGLLIALAAALDGASFLLQLISAQNLPATVMFPVFSGGTIIVSTIAGVLFFKEQLSKKAVASVILCFVGTFMFL